MIRHTYDIRAVKRNLRERYRGIRKGMSAEAKRLADARIRGRILHSMEYKRCHTLLCFVSMPIEVDTHELIRCALEDGKTVAVPYCVEGTRTMHFYRIHSLDELTPRTFGVLEPDPNTAERLTDFSKALCILPGLAFDYAGYRLGYGGGYYDRFLSKIFHGRGLTTIGICYANCIAHRLPRGRFDIPCDILITDQFVRRMHPPQKRDKAAHSARYSCPRKTPSPQ